MKQTLAASTAITTTGRTIPIEARISVTKREAAAAIGLSLASINRMLKTGELESLKVRKSRLVLVRSLLDLVERSKVPTPSKAAPDSRPRA